MMSSCVVEYYVKRSGRRHDTVAEWGTLFANVVCELLNYIELVIRNIFFGLLFPNIVNLIMMIYSKLGLRTVSASHEGGSNGGFEGR